MEGNIVDIENMTLDQLDRHIEDAKKQREKKKADQLGEKRMKVEEYAASLNTSIDELFGSRLGKSKPSSTKKKVLYIDDDGKPFGRAMKEWTDEQKGKYKINAEGQ
jgi:hypothetical protein